MGDGSLTYTPGISTNNGSSSTFFQADIKNSLRQTTQNQTTSATKQYDAFGNETSSTGTWQGPFGYKTDTDSGLKILGHRYYDASLGRFLSRDPVKDGPNWFAYCQSNPAAYADPAGLFFETVADLIGIGVGAKDFIDDPNWKTGAWLIGDIVFAAIPFLPNFGLARHTTKAVAKAGGEIADEAGKALVRKADDVPPIKAGSAGGEGAGKSFGKKTKEAAKRENPNSTCVFCRLITSNPHIDHSIPEARGGNNSIENAQVTCPHCNLSKGSGLRPQTPPPNYTGEFPPSWW